VSSGFCLSGYSCARFGFRQRWCCTIAARQVEEVHRAGPTQEINRNTVTTVKMTHSGRCCNNRRSACNDPRKRAAACSALRRKADVKNQMHHFSSGRRNNVAKLLKQDRREELFTVASYFYTRRLRRIGSARLGSRPHFSALTASPIQAPGLFSIMGYIMALGLR
jgi:hypothetical protein